MKSFTKRYKIKATIDQVWDALTNPETMERWGAGPEVVMTDEVGGEFKLWGGSIFGKNIEVKKNEILKQEWYGGRWKQPSIVTFTLTSDELFTTVDLEHKNLPDNEADSFNSGWDDFYMTPLKELFEK